MLDNQWRESLVRAELNLNGQVAANKLLILVALFFAGVSLVLAAGLGYLIGRHANPFRDEDGNARAEEQQEGARTAENAQESRSEGQNASALNSVSAEPPETTLEPRLNSRDGLVPVPSDRHVKDLDSAQEATAPGGSGGRMAAAAHRELVHLPLIPQEFDAEAVEAWKLQHLPQKEQEIYRNAENVFAAVSLPWTDSTPGTSRTNLGSRVPSGCSDISDCARILLTAQSSLEEKWANPEFNYRYSNLALLRAALQWQIPQEQLTFKRTPNGDRISLSASRRGRTFEAVLDGSIPVAVKCLNIPRDVLSDARLQELALQQLALNEAGYFVHFHGICRSDDSIMLVYDFIEGGNLTEAIQHNQHALQWYQNGRKIACSIAQGLAHLHSHEMEHRSLKSSQILISASDSSALIADAGLQALSQHSNHHWKDRFINNLNWGAPEFLTGKKCGPEADIFAFANVLWEIVTQEMPIREAFRPAESPAECPAPIKDLIIRCRAQDPLARPTADEVLDIIQRSWNMTADGQGVFMESQRKRPSASRRASSGGQLSIDPKPVRPKLTNPRLTCDSVSSMLAAKPPVSQAALLAQAVGNQAAREALQGAKSRPGRPPHSPQSMDLRDSERQLLTQKSASLGGYLNQEEVRALLENPLLGTLPSIVPKNTAKLDEAAAAFRRADTDWQNGSASKLRPEGMSFDERRLLSERRARSRNLKPVRSADFPMRTRPLIAGKPNHANLARLDASMASSRDNVLQQTRSGSTSPASTPHSRTGSDGIFETSKSHIQATGLSGGGSNSSSGSEAPVKPKKLPAAFTAAFTAPPPQYKRHSFEPAAEPSPRLPDPTPSALPESFKQWLGVSKGDLTLRALSERQLPVVLDLEPTPSRRSLSASDMRGAPQHVATTLSTLQKLAADAEMLKAKESPPASNSVIALLTQVQDEGSLTTSPETESLQCSNEDEFVNPFTQSRHSEGWQRFEERSPMTNREALSNPSVALSSLSHMPVDSFASAEEGQPRRNSSCITRWKQKCDLTFTKWLNRPSPDNSAEFPRTSLRPSLEATPFESQPASSGIK